MPSNKLTVGTVRRILLVLYALINLFPVYGNISRRADANTYLVALYTQHRDGDVFADFYGFANPSCQYEHLFLTP